MRPFSNRMYRKAILPTPYDDLLTQKEALMEQIRALEFDHDTGKLPDEEYNEHRADLVQQAADVLRQIDAMDSAESTLQLLPILTSRKPPLPAAARPKHQCSNHSCHYVPFRFSTNLSAF